MIDTPRGFSFADHAVQESAVITENTRVARDTYRLRFACPTMAERFLPGQFLMLRLSGFNDPLIGRPLAMYDRIDEPSGQPAAIDVMYLAGGKLTRKLRDATRGQLVDVWGPLGNGFPPADCNHLVMVAGGIGQTPFLTVAKEALGRQHFGQPSRTAPQLEKVTLCYGARTQELLAGVEDFRRLGVDVQLATDDGTAGLHGLVTDLLRNLVRSTTDLADIHVICCGPRNMMKTVAQITTDHNVSCQVSLEEPMACGIGICFSCVAPLRQDDGSCDYQRTCVQGPVFDAAAVIWD